MQIAFRIIHYFFFPDRAMWSNQTTRAYIEPFGVVSTAPKCKQPGKKQEKYEDMAMQLLNDFSRELTHGQVKKQWSSLKLRYEALKLKEKQSGAAAVCWLLYDDMDEVLGKRLSYNPVATNSSKRLP